MTLNRILPIRSVLMNVFTFQATPEVVSSLVPANSDRSRVRVTREEMLSLFHSELRANNG